MTTRAPSQRMAEPQAARAHSPGELTVRVLPDPERGPVTPDGPLRSIQEAEVAMDAETFERFWRPQTLERLARGYWRGLKPDSVGVLRRALPEWSQAVVLGRG